MVKVKFDIQGMTCSSCSAHVERAVKKIDGVKNVNVNLLSNSMDVEYDDKVLGNNDIINAVVEAGYGANTSEEKTDNNKENKDKKTEDNSINNMKKRLIISICFLIPLMYLAMHHMFYEWFKLPIPNIIKTLFDGEQNAITFAFTQFLLLLPIIYVNRNFFIIGFKRLFKRSPNMDSLIALGSSAATIYGIFAIFMIGYGLGHSNIDLVIKYSKDIYFESAGTILTLITLGKYLETRSKGKTTEAISKLINLAPKTAIVIRDEKEVEIKVEDVVIGDILVIKPGSSIPVDGIIIEGNTLVDESSITGESVPVERQEGNILISGTINKNGYVKMRATKVGADTTLSQIIKLVEEASNSKAPISKLADKVSGVFVPIVIIIAVITFVFWILNGQNLEVALNFSIAVLVISCPCALGLATPVAIMVGTGRGAKNGILIKSAESLETLHLIDTVILDKTGTITEGKPEVTDIINLSEEVDLLQIAATLEKKSEHPLSEAILKRVKEENKEILDVSEFKAISGRGVTGKIQNKTYFGGNIAFMQENNINIYQIDTKVEELLSQGKTCIYFSDSENIIGVIAAQDLIKDTSYKAINELKKRKIDVAMVTGDNRLVANAIGDRLRINNIISEVLPQGKQEEVSKIQSRGNKVAFVGDGINDSPALVKADVGIAISSGTDIAIESADIVLMKNSLLDVVTAIDLSKKVINNIKLNLFWAFIYNAIGIPIATGLFYIPFGLKLNPMIGALAMSLSSVCVVTNALRLKNFKVNFKEENKMNITKTVYINGMQCNHCKMSVEKALNTIEEIVEVNVDLDKKYAIVKLVKDVNNDRIKEVIKEAGFKVEDIK